MCCIDVPDVLVRLQSEGECIIDHEFFAHIVSDEGVHYSRSLVAAKISNYSERHEFLSKPFDNKLERNVVYGNFVAWINQYIPMGRGNRMLNPRCVILKIRQLYPDDKHQYTGFRPNAS